MEVSIAPNKYHGRTDQAEMSREDWENCWKEGRTFFDKPQPHILLLKHIDTLLNGQRTGRIFLPMCGKSLDIKWLYDHGHTVVGVEGSQLAVEEFFKDHSLDYTMQTADGVNGNLYQTKDNKIRLYCCDIFNFTCDTEGKFDAIWDRGALGAVNHSDRVRYATLMKSLMSSKCRYLVDAFNYDESKFSGPPRSVPDAVYQNIYGTNFEIELIDSINQLNIRKETLGLERFDEELRLIVHKK